MADQLQIRGGDTASNSTFTGAQRELSVDTSKNQLIVHDGATPGGHPIPTSDDPVFTGTASFGGSATTNSFVKAFDTEGGRNVTAGLCRFTGGQSYGLTVAPADDENNFTASINADGTATFSNTVTTGDALRLTDGALNSSNTFRFQLADSVTASPRHDLCLIPSQAGNDAPGVIFQRLNAASNTASNMNVLIGGDLTGGSYTPNIALNADGTASFAGNVTAGPATGGGKIVMQGMGSTNGELVVSNPTGSNSLNCFRVVGQSTNTIVFKQGGSATFSGNITAGNVSDIKFKKNITDAKSQLADVVSLGSSLKNWDWKEDAPLNDELRSKRFLGLIAQEAEVICPSLTYTVERTEQGKELTPETTDAEGNVVPAIYEELNDSYKAINHDILVMKLLGAVAELKAEVEALKAKKA